MTLLVFSIHSGARAVEMLPRATCQSRFHHCCALSMELLLVFDQQVRELSRTDRHAHRAQEVQDLWLAHPICIVKRQDPCSDSGSKLTSVARWKRCQIRPLLAGRVVFLDRKSTRLNSSHANISYAVFC